MDLDASLNIHGMVSKLFSEGLKLLKCTVEIIRKGKVSCHLCQSGFKAAAQFRNERGSVLHLVLLPRRTM